MPSHLCALMDRLHHANPPKNPETEVLSTLKQGRGSHRNKVAHLAGMQGFHVHALLTSDADSRWPHPTILDPESPASCVVFMPKFPFPLQCPNPAPANPSTPCPCSNIAAFISARCVSSLYFPCLDFDAPPFLQPSEHVGCSIVPALTSLCVSVSSVLPGLLSSLWAVVLLYMPVNFLVVATHCEFHVVGTEYVLLLC